MASKIKLYLRLLKAELEDLKDDLGLIDERCAARLGSEEITPYVFKENDALLKHEMRLIDKLIEIVDGLDESLYNSVEDLEEDLLFKARGLLSSGEEPEAVELFLSRKLAKVNAYLRSGD